MATSIRTVEGGSEHEGRSPSAGNSLRSTPKRNSVRPADSAVAERKWRPVNVADENSISHTKSAGSDRRRRRLANAATKADNPSHAASEPRSRTNRAIPEEVQRRFVQTGNKYYFADGALAFTDRGHKLTTVSENTEVIKSLVAIAQARGWQDVAVTGTERFRREAWFAAKLAGLEVRGHTPDEFEQGRLIRTMARRASMPATPASTAGAGVRSDDAPARATDEPNRKGASQSLLWIGRLVDHGPATYRHDPREPMSYFVKLETPRREREIWGVDLERAFKESLTHPQIGDQVALRTVRQEPVTVTSHERDAAGKVLSKKEVATHRNRWIVEKPEFFEARARAARALRDPEVDSRRAVERHPELAGTYLNLRAAELASQRIRDPQDQRKFVALVRNALADSVARGEPLAPVRLRERSGVREAPRPDRARTREPQVRS